MDNTQLDELTNVNLPTTLDLSKWGKVNKVFDNFFQISNGKILFSVIETENVRSVSITSGNIQSKSFKDIIVNKNKDEFVREMSNGIKIYYTGGIQTMLEQKERPAVFMKPIKKDPKYKFEAITMDLETRQVRVNLQSMSELEVISIALYDGEDFLSYFCLDFVSSEAMIQKAMIDIFNKY